MKIVITGGNGGIAKGIASVLARAGHIVYTPGRSDMDVTDYIQIMEYMQKVKPDVLINNAGYIVPHKVKDITPQEWRDHIGGNLTGVLYCSQIALGWGCQTIITIGSTSAFEGRPEWGAYCVAKAGVIALTESMANEGINAYTINPSRTKSKMRERLFPNEDQSTLMNPERIGEFVLKIMNGEYKRGSHLVVKKDEYYVLPPRKGV